MVLFSCCPQNKFQLGAQINGDISSRNKIMIPSGALLDVKEIHYKNISYTLAISENKKIKYISTKDSKFSVEKLKINDDISKIFDETKIKYIPGWGYYMKVNSEWYAGLDFRMKPTKSSKIGWFFKYEFSEPNPNLFK